MSRRRASGGMSAAAFMAGFSSGTRTGIPAEHVDALRSIPPPSWTVRVRAASDFHHVFYATEQAGEADARATYERKREHAAKHGGAGSLERDGVIVDRFSIWCPND